MHQDKCITTPKLILEEKKWKKNIFLKVVKGLYEGIVTQVRYKHDIHTCIHYIHNLCMALFPGLFVNKI